MSILSKLWRRLARDRAGRNLAEYDAPADTGTARTRATGGVHKPGALDTHSTTGTTPSGTFVGRAGGDDPGQLDEPDGSDDPSRRTNDSTETDRGGRDA